MSDAAFTHDVFLSHSAKDKAAVRVPILLRLGDIATEQDLEGLLGKTFTTGIMVRYYSFDVFDTLNRAGQFVTILDGFDERKHTLSWEQFRFNFMQINRLVNENSRVLILGRPNAFLNDDEFNYALHGIRIISQESLRDPDWPDYVELHLAFFSSSQASQFLTSFTQHQQAKRGVQAKAKPISPEDLERLIDQVSSKHFSDIARRPVQLRMLAEILPQWRGSVEDITIAILYDTFIGLVIEREQQKTSRQYFSGRDRRIFAKTLAWFLWRTKRVMSVTLEDIPEDIWANFITDKRRSDPIKRDLLTACFLSRKPGGALYFPHRSFQEYLVAEALLEKLTQDEISLAEADASTTDELGYFAQAIVVLHTLKKLAGPLAHHKGLLSWRLAQMWFASEGYAGYLLSQMKSTSVPWYPLFILAGIGGKKLTSVSVERFTEALLEKMEADLPADYVLLSHLCVLALSECFHPRAGSPMRDAAKRSFERLLSKRLSRDSHPFHGLLGAYFSRFVIGRISLPLTCAAHTISWRSA